MTKVKHSKNKILKMALDKIGREPLYKKVLRKAISWQPPGE
jgi:hypothetical protein